MIANGLAHENLTLENPTCANRCLAIQDFVSPLTSQATPRVVMGSNVQSQ